MLRAHRPDYRRSSESALLEGLRSKDPLALAEVYHRTVPAAYACARRLLGAPGETEALLQTVYGELWDQPPDAGPLEGWIRSRCFELGAAHLRELRREPAAASLYELLPDLPAPPDRRHDPVEELLAGLEPRARRVLLDAHDRGVPAGQVDDPHAAAALEAALTTLAGSDAGGEQAPDATACGDLPLGDWVLGLVPADVANRVEQEAAAREACALRARFLRRGRRRLEGLPPTPDMGHRILVSITADVQSRPVAAATSGGELTSALDTEVEDELAAEDELVVDDEFAVEDELVVDDELAVDDGVTFDEELEPEGEVGLGAPEAPEEVEDWDVDLAEPWAPDEEAREPLRWQQGPVEAKPRRLKRALAFIGVLLLVALGALAGMYLGSLVVGG